MIKNIEKTTILIDGSFLMHRSAESLYSRMSHATAHDLAFSMIKDFKAMIRDLQPFGNQLIYALDSMSWRKQKSTEYKGNREKKNDISDIYEAHNRMLDSVKPSGINIIRVNNAEADDIIFKWSSTLALDGHHVLIISEDKDLNQLVYSYDLVGTHIFQYRPISKKFIVPIGFKEVLKDLNKPTDLNDLLEGIEETNILLELNKWVLLKGLDIIEINADEVSFIKMLTGDKGDNVSSIYEYEKNGRNFKFTENQAYKVLNLYKYHLNIDELLNEDNLNHLNDCIQKVLKVDLDFREKIKENYSLVVLNNLAFPEHILDSLNYSLNRNLNPFYLKTLLESKVENNETDLVILEDENSENVETNLNKSENKPEDSKDSFWDNFINL